MKHEWEPLPLRRTIANFMDPTRRKCKHCGAIQTLITETAWMRIVARRWVPLVGRCKPKPRPIQILNRLPNTKHDPQR